MDEATGQVAADHQIAEAMAAERESLSLECRADAARLLAPDFRWQIFHHQGTIVPSAC
jgi:hypothetical protein